MHYSMNEYLYYVRWSEGIKKITPINVLCNHKAVLYNAYYLSALHISFRGECRNWSVHINANNVDNIGTDQ